MKRFALYALSRWYQLVILVACIALIVFVLSGTGINRHALTLVSLTVCGAWLMMLIFSFLHVQTTWHSFNAIAGSESPLDERMPRETSAPEQSAAIRACETLSCSARERLDTVATGALEHREYIESWVHEIKTPIAAAYLALDNTPGTGANQIASQLDRVGFYVDQALFFARSSSVERDYFISRLSVPEVVSAAVRERRRSLIDAHMNIDISGIGDNICVLSDEKWLIFMLGQLIDNAVKYRISDADTKPVLSFSAVYEGEGSGRTVVLTVADNGCGISAADMPRIFDKGFTGKNGRARNEKATGLGLYLVAKLAQKMGLGIRADSKPSEGAAFSFVFPMPQD